MCTSITGVCLQAFESELRDSTEFYLWQTEMRDRDAAIRKEQVSRSIVVYSK